MLKLGNILSGLIVVTSMFLVCIPSNAQSSKSFGEIYIPDKSSISIFNKHTFHDGGNGIYPGTIATERENNKGYINFIAGSSWLGASDMQHIDGYARVYHNEPFTFPIGANSKYRPVAISGAARTSAAYYDNNPGFINEKGIQKTELKIHKISELEYWDIEGDVKTQITLTWDQRSGVETLTENELNRLTIVGWSGNQWEVIPSSIDRFVLDYGSSSGRKSTLLADFSKGSISTNDLIRPNEFVYFTLGTIHPNLMGKVQL